MGSHASFILITWVLPQLFYCLVLELYLFLLFLFVAVIFLVAAGFYLHCFYYLVFKPQFFILSWLGPLADIYMMLSLCS